MTEKSTLGFRASACSEAFIMYNNIYIFANRMAKTVHTVALKSYFLGQVHQVYDRYPGRFSLSLLTISNKNINSSGIR